MRGPRRALLPALAAAALLAGCQAGPAPSTAPAPDGSTPAATCAELAAQIVDAVQDYVDTFAQVDAAGLPAAAGAQQGALATSTADLRSRGAELGCERDDLADLVRAELDRLVGGTPVQDALVATFRADPLGTYDPSDPAPVTITVATAEELVVVLALAGSGSTITLAAGTYAVDVPLIALRPITLRGAGTRSTVLQSTAGGGAFIASSDGDVRLQDLSVVHDGDAPASVVLVTAGGYAFERVRISGGVADADGVGGFGAVLRPERNPLTSRGTTQTLTDVTFADNAGGGLVVAGSAQPTVRGAAVSGATGCGLCWLEDGGGRVVDSTVTGMSVGLRVDDGAAPRVSGLTVDGPLVGLALTGSGATEVRDSLFTGNSTGLEIGGTGRAVIQDVEVAASVDVGVRVSSRARPLLGGLVVVGPATAGLAVVQDAAPEIQGGTVTTTGEVGAIWAERAAGTARGLTVHGARLGFQLADDAAPGLQDLSAEDTGAASLLAGGRSGGTVAHLTCATGTTGIVALVDQTTVRLSDSVGCEVVDER